MDHSRDSRPLAFTPRPPASSLSRSSMLSTPSRSSDDSQLPSSTSSASPSFRLAATSPHVLVQPTSVPPPAPFKVRGTDTLEDAWRTWRQAWDAYSIVTRLSEESSEYRVAMLLSVIGPFGVRMFNGLPFDSDAAKKSIDRVLALFAAKCVGETNVIYERYLFLDRRQGASEDFEEYLTDLKAIVRRCDYGSMEDALLRDRIVHGIVRESVRKRLQSKKDLTLEKCVALCRADAKTTSQAQTMRRVSNPKQTVDDELHVVRSSSLGAATRSTPAGNAPKNAPSARKNETDNAPRDTTSRPRRIDCHYCGLNHIYGRKHCSAVGNKCSSCGGVDHFPRVCRKRLGRRDQVQQIEEADEDDEVVRRRRATTRHYGS